MILIGEYGLHFASEGDLHRCVEFPNLVMFPGERCRVGERECGTLEDALRHVRGGRLVLAAEADV